MSLNASVANSSFLYKAVRIKTIQASPDEIRIGGPALISATRSEASLKGEFGDWVLQIEVNRLPAEVTLIPVEYTYEWMAENPAYCQKITGLSLEYWADWVKLNYPGAPIEEAITDEISAVYAEEAEVIIQGLTYYDLEFAHIKGKLRRR